MNTTHVPSADRLPNVVEAHREVDSMVMADIGGGRASKGTGGDNRNRVGASSHQMRSCGLRIPASHAHISVSHARISVSRQRFFVSHTRIPVSREHLFVSHARSSVALFARHTRACSSHRDGGYGNLAVDCGGSAKGYGQNDKLLHLTAGIYHGYPNRNRARDDPRKCNYHPMSDGAGGGFTPAVADLGLSSMNGVL